MDETMSNAGSTSTSISTGSDLNPESICTKFGLSLLLDESSNNGDQPTAMIMGRRDIKAENVVPKSPTMSSDDEYDKEEYYDNVPLPPAPAADEDNDDKHIFDPSDDDEDIHLGHPSPDRCSLLEELCFSTINGNPYDEFEVTDFDILGCDKSKNEMVYFVWLGSDIVSESQCIDVLKEIDCQNGFIRCPKKNRRHFIARLSKEQAYRVKGASGVVNVQACWGLRSSRC